MKFPLRILFTDGGEGGGAAEETKTTPEETKTEGAEAKTGAEETVSKEQFNKLSEEIKKIAKERDDYKGKIKSEEDAKKIADGKYQELLDEKERELKAKEAELEEYKPYKDKLTEYETKRRDGLLADLPDEFKAIGEALPLEKLEDYVKLHSKKDPANHDGGAPGTNSEKELTSAEMEDAKRMFPYISDKKKLTSFYNEVKSKKNKEKDKE